jgi:hypothetical protein
MSLITFERARTIGLNVGWRMECSLDEKGRSGRR